MSKDKCVKPVSTRYCLSQAVNTSMSLDTATEYVTLAIARASTCVTTDSSLVALFTTFNTATSSTGSNGAALLVPGQVIPDLPVQGGAGYIALSGVSGQATTQGIDVNVIEMRWI